MPYPYYQAPMQAQQPMQAQMPIQNNGFIMVRNEAEARNFPVGFGNSVTFKDESAPFVYTKTMGYSQMQPPIFEKYRLVKEEVKDETTNPSHSAIDEIKQEIMDIWAEVDFIKGDKSTKKEIRNNGRHGKRDANLQSISAESDENVIEEV